ncbi:Lsr2 family protein [soil metagenome]
MAQKVNIVLVDDIDETEATETVTFGLDGTTYEIDLNDEHAAALRDAISGYIGHARKVSASKRNGRKSAAATTGTNASEIRDWARSNGMEVPDRGRIPANVREAFESAN